MDLLSIGLYPPLLQQKVTPAKESWQNLGCEVCILSFILTFLGSQISIVGNNSLNV